MESKFILTIMILLSSACHEVSSRPSDSESNETINSQYFERPDNIEDEIARSAPPIDIQYPYEVNTKSILEKISSVNEGLSKPHREKINLNKLQTANLEVDQELLMKIQHLIASGKLNAFSDLRKQTVNNDLGDDSTRMEYAKAMPYLQQNQLKHSQGNFMILSVPYVAALPIVISPSMINFQNSDQNTLDSQMILTRQGFPSFNIPWPLASYFPVHITDPLQAFLSGSNFIEYGPAADVCKRRQKFDDPETNDIDNEIRKYHYNQFKEALVAKSRQARAVGKRNVSTKTTPVQKIDNKINKNEDKPKKFFSKPLLNKPLLGQQTQTQRIKVPVPVPYDPDQDLRFGNGDIGWFWHKKTPPVPNPGFFINRLKVKKGGVAIAGPGGVATAGHGGAAIVGPGGLAYTQPGGLAVAGPAARVVALSSDVDLSSVVTRLREQAAEDGSVPRLLDSVPEGKVVATGPVVYYHPTKE